MWQKFIKLLGLSCICVLLLGLSCQSLAVTSDEVASYIYNWMTKEGTVNVVTVSSWLENNKSFIDTFVYNANLSDRWVVRGNPGYTNGNRNSVDICYVNVLNDEHPGVFYFNNNGYFSYGANNDNLQTFLYRLTLSGSNITVTQSTTYFVSGQSSSSYFSNANAYTSSGGSTIKVNAGCYPDGYNSGYEYNNTVWEFIPINSQSYVVGDSPHNFYRINKGVNNVVCGYLEDSVYTLSVGVFYEYYDKENQEWQVAYSRIPYNIDRDVLISEVYSTINTSNDTLKSTLTVPNNLITENMIVHFIIQGESPSGPLETIEEFFYVFGPNTVYSGDTIDITSTFNDNYYDDYLDDVDDIVNDPTNQIINSVDNINNTITDSSEVDTIIASFLSGDSGDIGLSLGYQEFNNPFEQFIFGTFQNVLNILLVQQDVTLDLNHHGSTNFVLNSRDFKLPNNAFTAFIRTLLTFIVVYLLYKFFFFIIHAIQTLDLSKIKSNLIDDDLNDLSLM